MAPMGVGSCRTPLFAALAANLINLALDLVLIFVLGMGVAGAAIATTISQVRLGCRVPSPRAPPACPQTDTGSYQRRSYRPASSIHVSSTHFFPALRFAREL